jgi:hypothetical protein
VKRRDLMKELRDIAKAQGLELVATEGGSHTKVAIGDRQTTVPRHNEISELTAKGILKYMTPEGE